MGIVDAPSFVEHVVCFGGFGVAVGVVAAVGGDVGPDVGEQVGAVAGGLDGGFEARELGAVLLQDFAVAGQVGGFEGAGGGFGVEEAGELLEEGGALGRVVLVGHVYCCFIGVCLLAI